MSYEDAFVHDNREDCPIDHCIIGDSSGTELNNFLVGDSPDFKIYAKQNIPEGYEEPEF